MLAVIFTHWIADPFFLASLCFSMPALLHNALPHPFVSCHYCAVTQVFIDVEFAPLSTSRACILTVALLCFFFFSKLNAVCTAEDTLEGYASFLVDQSTGLAKGKPCSILIGRFLSLLGLHACLFVWLSVNEACVAALCHTWYAQTSAMGHLHHRRCA